MLYIEYIASMNEVEFNAFKKKMGTLFGEETILGKKVWEITVHSAPYIPIFFIYGVKFHRQEDIIMFKMVFG